MRCVLIGLLLGVYTSSPQDAPPQTPKQRYEALLKEYEAEELAWNLRYGGGKLEDPEALLEARYRDWPGWAFSVRFLEFAESNPTDPKAVDALILIVNQSISVGVSDRQLVPPYARALDLLTQDHRFDDKRVAEACIRALHYASPWTEQYLRTVLDQAKDRDARGLACLQLARLLANRRTLYFDAWFDEEARSPFQSFIRQRLDAFYMAYIRTTDPKAVEEEAERLFERSIREFGDVVCRRDARPGGHDKRIAEVARSELNEFRKPAVGRPAPEIEGEDANGRRLKLSDYQDQVVVLTFSGDWDADCRHLYPHVRQLLERYKDQPFVVLSVDNDKDRDTLPKAIQDGQITWRCWWDGGLGGPIATAWGVTSVPTVFMLDHEGMIRYKGTGDDRLDKAVEALLKKAKASRSGR
jgi:peroxiredoxin